MADNKMFAMFWSGYLLLLAVIVGVIWGV